MPEIVGRMKDIRPTVKGGYQIPVHKSEVHGMKTQPFGNESTISGLEKFGVLQSILRDSGSV